MKENTGKDNSTYKYGLSSFYFFPVLPETDKFTCKLSCCVGLYCLPEEAASGPAGMPAAFRIAAASQLRQREGQQKLDFPTEPSSSPIALIASDQGKLRTAKQRHLFSAVT